MSDPTPEPTEPDDDPLTPEDEEWCRQFFSRPAFDPEPEQS